MKITSVELDISAVRISQYPFSNHKEFLLVGRSNVGKSSFINVLINRKNYARTSGQPGKTQTLNFYNINETFYLVDAPGYGYATTSKENRAKFGKMIEEYLKTRDTLEKVFLLIDFRHKLGELDKTMYEYLKHYAVPTVVVATKVDKVKNSAVERQKKALIKDLNLSKNDEFVMFSSITKEGKKEIQDIIENAVQ